MDSDTGIYLLCIMFASAYCSTAYNDNIRQAYFPDVDTEQFGYMSRLGRVFILVIWRDHEHPEDKTVVVFTLCSVGF